MGVNLGGAANTQMVPTVVALQQTVDPLRLATRLVALGFVRRKGDLLPLPGIVVDQRDVPLLAAYFTDDPAAIGRVSQIVEIGDPLTGHAHYQDRRYRDVTLRGVDMEFVAGTVFHEALAVFS